MKQPSTTAKASKFCPERSASGKPSPAQRRYLLAQVTLQQKQAILEYCQSSNLSVGRFLAQVALDDTRSKEKRPCSRVPQRNHPTSVQSRRTIVVHGPAPKKIHLPVRGPGSRYTLPTQTLRVGLNAREHALVKKHMQSQHVCFGHYLAQLALQAIQPSSRRAAKPFSPPFSCLK